jgi:hypothetical protein
MPGTYGTVSPVPPPPNPYGTQSPVPPNPYSVPIPLPPANNGGPQPAPAEDVVLSVFEAHDVAPEVNAYNVQVDPSGSNAPPTTPSLPPQSVAPAFTRPGALNPMRTGKAPILGSMASGCDRSDAAKGVKYISAVTERRNKYKIEIGAIMRRRTLDFDTQAIRDNFIRKGNQIGAAKLGRDKRGNLISTPTEWQQTALIWVCAPEPPADAAAIYSHVCKIDRFHHSSLVAGSKVMGSGDWIVRKGKLWKISGNSGHYRQSIDFLYQSVMKMSAAFQPDTTVFLYDSIDDKWIDYPIRSFVSNASNGGRLWPHPEAVRT